MYTALFLCTPCCERRTQHPPERLELWQGLVELACKLPFELGRQRGSSCGGRNDPGFPAEPGKSWLVGHQKSQKSDCFRGLRSCRFSGSHLFLLLCTKAHRRTRFDHRTRSSAMRGNQETLDFANCFANHLPGGGSRRKPGARSCETRLLTDRDRESVRARETTLRAKITFTVRRDKPA